MTVRYLEVTPKTYCRYCSVLKGISQQFLAILIVRTIGLPSMSLQSQVSLKIFGTDEENMIQKHHFHIIWLF